MTSIVTMKTYQNTGTGVSNSSVWRTRLFHFIKLQMLASVVLSICLTPTSSDYHQKQKRNTSFMSDLSRNLPVIQVGRGTAQSPLDTLQSWKVCVHWLVLWVTKLTTAYERLLQLKCSDVVLLKTHWRAYWTPFPRSTSFLWKARWGTA